MERKSIIDFVMSSKNNTKSKELVWNVLKEDINSCKIYAFNVFDNSYIRERLYEVYKENRFSFKHFKEKARIVLMSEFWARSQHEVIITSWPPYIEKSELIKLNKELEQHPDQYRFSVNLSVAEKVDVFSQLAINWELFMKYVWKNKKLLKEIKK